jgi:hypothetical protein
MVDAMSRRVSLERVPSTLVSFTIASIARACNASRIGCSSSANAAISRQSMRASSELTTTERGSVAFDSLRLKSAVVEKTMPRTYERDL